MELGSCNASDIQIEWCLGWSAIGRSWIFWDIGTCLLLDHCFADTYPWKCLRSEVNVIWWQRYLFMLLLEKMRKFMMKASLFWVARLQSYMEGFPSQKNSYCLHFPDSSHKETWKLWRTSSPFQSLPINWQEFHW